MSLLILVEPMKSTMFNPRMKDLDCAYLLNLNGGLFSTFNTLLESGHNRVISIVDVNLQR